MAQTMGAVGRNANRDARFIARADEGATVAQTARRFPSVCAERIRQIVARHRRRFEMKRNGVSVREWKGHKEQATKNQS